MSNIYKINNKKFKSIYVSYNFTLPIVKEQVTENAVLSSLLGKESNKFASQQDVEMYLANLYGADFDTIVEKIGDLYNLEFRIEFVNKKFLPHNTDIFKQCLEFLYEVIYNPKVENGKFGKEIVEREKKYISEKINERKDEKIKYAVFKTEEAICKQEPFGVYVYGNSEDIEKIDEFTLYSRYLDVITNSCVTIMVSGNIEGYENIDSEIEKIFGNKINNRLEYKDLKSYTKPYINRSDDVEEISEKAETSQSVLTMAFKVQNPEYNDIYSLNVYNAILGSTPSSKLFQNFREKESLAYTVRSRYYRYKGFFLIYAGIDAKNYEKAKKVILAQLKMIENGEISEEEFEAAKQSLISDLLEWEDSKIALAKFLLGNLVIYEDSKMTVNDMIKGIRNVSVNDIIMASKKIKLQTIYFLGGEADV